MSAGYADRLSEYNNKGVCGLPELPDTSARALGLKLKRLHEMVRDSKRLVILTGAGISTSAGIPDFRGPRGIWTLEKKADSQAKKKRKKLVSNSESNEKDRMRSGDPSTASKAKQSRDESPPAMEFTSARPTITHRAIARLAIDNVIKYCITQNVDGLHRRSGLPRSCHSVLHGCVFTEKCDACGMEYFRDYDIGGMSFKKTGRKCTSGCQKGDLRDTLLDWEDHLPEYDLWRAEEECEKSDLVICLGTSLRMKPADGLPLKAKKFVIVNLQATPYDEEASLIIRARVDDVLKSLMEYLEYEDNWKYEQLSCDRTWSPPKDID